MPKINAIFNQLDVWRHFPSYQLERRADLYFSLYLAEVLESKIGKKIRKEIIPEFPVRRGAIGIDKDRNRPFRIDYVALTADGAEAILVELKTDTLSRNVKQDYYLKASAEAGFGVLLGGVLDISRIPGLRSKNKYFALLDYLSKLGQISVPEEIRKSPIWGTAKAVKDIAVTSAVTSTKVIYVQPKGGGPEVIDFDYFRAVVKEHADPVSGRFEKSLAEWGSVVAGEWDV